jgi:hypothetical protein
MKESANGKGWIDAYVARKDKELGRVALGLRSLVKKLFRA